MQLRGLPMVQRRPTGLLLTSMAQLAAGLPGTWEMVSVDTPRTRKQAWARCVVC